MYIFVDKAAGGISLPEFSYFGVQAYWGATRHFGGLNATEELAEVCHINKDTIVLEVGCGIGLTACYLAKRYSCRVAGVDLSEQMIDLSRKRASREGVADRLEFRTADAQLLPFEDGLFDVVICESVTAFLNDPQKGVREYVRVAKPGGYVGLNEGTWIRTPPPTELVAFIDRTMARATFLTSDEWRELMDNAGLTDIVARPYTLTALRQLISEIRGLGFEDLIRGCGRFLSLYIKSPAFRKYAKEITPSGTIIKSLFAYLGYGIYVGRK
jgi:ubiquinone/menaquinone biosynthesis C-methylase UbiE